jgi:hypothetical protein
MGVNGSKLSFTLKPSKGHFFDVKMTDKALEINE